MDWSHLTTLELNSASLEVLRKLALVLTSSTSFGIKKGYGELPQEFTTNSHHPLESTSTRNAGHDDLDRFVLGVAFHHGSVLKLHTILGPQLTVSHVTGIREAYPKLETLDLNVERLVQSLDNDI